MLFSATSIWDWIERRPPRSERMESASVSRQRRTIPTFCPLRISRQGIVFAGSRSSRPRFNPPAPTVQRPSSTNRPLRPEGTTIRRRRRRSVSRVMVVPCGACTVRWGSPNSNLTIRLSPNLTNQACSPTGPDTNRSASSTSMVSAVLDPHLARRRARLRPAASAAALAIFRPRGSSPDAAKVVVGSSQAARMPKTRGRGASGRTTTPPSDYPGRIRRPKPGT